MSETVVVVTNIPRPYRTALFATLKQQFAALDLQLRVLYTSDPSKHARRGSQAAVVADAEMESFVPGIDIGVTYDRVLTLPWGLGRAIAHLQPACVVLGGFGPSALTGARWCRRARVPYVIWSGAWPITEGKLGRLQRLSRVWLLRGAAAFITYGTAAADYLVTLGAPRDRIYPAWNTVDLEGIAGAALVARQKREELAGKHALAAKNLLCVSSLVARKGVRELVAAALAAGPPTSDWALHFAGGGPLTEELESAVRAAGKQDHFRFHGLKPESEVAELLGMADGLFLLSWQEAWGLVINEAMACGVPVVASPLAGATRDLIDDGVTGYVVHPADKQALTAIFSRLVSGDPECAQVGRAGAEAVRAMASLDKTGERFVSAVRRALEGDRHA
jgi:glycosyltransferase involved in cell wall biosynthesis